MKSYSISERCSNCKSDTTQVKEYDCDHLIDAFNCYMDEYFTIETYRYCSNCKAYHHFKLHNIKKWEKEKEQKKK
jgi:hypothetical protein